MQGTCFSRCLKAEYLARLPNTSFIETFLHAIAQPLVSGLARRCMLSSVTCVLPLCPASMQVSLVKTGRMVMNCRTSGLEAAAFASVHNSTKRGDIVGVRGYPGKSKNGELSIFPVELQVLSPCLHMLPTDRSGLKDQVSPFDQRRPPSNSVDMVCEFQ